MPIPGGVLALDLSGTVGWAYGPIDSPRPVFGCWRLPPQGGEGGRYVAFENELAAAIDTLAPSALILEAALSLQAMARGSNIMVARQQLTLRGIAYMEGYRASIAVSEVDATTVREGILGQSRFKKGAVKAEVVRYCKSHGLDVPDHNAGDACLTFLWHTTQLRGGRPVAGPLFVEPVL